MSAITRWVRYDTTATSTAGTGGGAVQGTGTRGYVSANSAVDDTFIIGANNNRLYVTMDGSSPPSYIQLTISGTDLDPRLIAKEITEKLHGASILESYARAQCVWQNNHFKIYSGSLNSASFATISSGTNTAHLELGFGTKQEVGGFASTNGGTNNGITVSGTYNGFFDETYRVVIAGSVNVATPSKSGGNTYTGTITANSAVNTAVEITYTLIISTTSGTTMGGGTGNVPVLTWTTNAAIDDSTNSSDATIEKRPIELLYSNYWYHVGTKGLMVKFSDAVFNSCNPAWTIVCSAITTVDGTNASGPKGTNAHYIWSSSRGDNAGSAFLTSDGGYTRLGSRGLSVRFEATSNLTACDEYYVVCSPPQPAAYDITSLNFGNVTVSTESPVRAVMFEILSGAVEISTVKFGLQSHGTFTYHDGSPTGTKLRFGTVGPGNNAGTSPSNGYEWWSGVTAADISSDSPPGYLYATKADLGVVSDADNSESIGISTYMGMCADPIWMNIKLGNSEVGANSTINYRVYFDYS